MGVAAGAAHDGGISTRAWGAPAAAAPSTGRRTSSIGSQRPAPTAQQAQHSRPDHDPAPPGLDARDELVHTGQNATGDLVDLRGRGKGEPKQTEQTNQKNARSSPPPYGAEQSRCGRGARGSPDGGARKSESTRRAQQQQQQAAPQRRRTLRRRARCSLLLYQKTFIVGSTENWQMPVCTRAHRQSRPWNLDNIRPSGARWLT